MHQKEGARQRTFDCLGRQPYSPAKGFALWDLAPGHYILHAAGGTTLTLAGEPLPLDHGLTTLDAITQAMTPRQKFIAAASPRLAGQILRALQ